MLENLPATVKIFEVGPRDGLQNEAKFVPTEDKVKLIEALLASGIKNIEITSFVSPKWIPQLSDGLQVVQSIQFDPRVTRSALVPNLKGYEQAKDSGINQIALFMSATETHSQKNINKGIEEALSTLTQVAQRARSDRFSIRVYLSVAFVCPYEGSVSPDQVSRIVSRLLEIGFDEISLGDTSGRATPDKVVKLVQLLSKEVDLKKMALHFHDTRGTALANVLAGLESGVRVFDASVGGMGGCPYAPGAAGNLATEDLVYLLEGMGIDCGVNLDRLIDAGQLAQEILQKKLPGRCLAACLSSRQSARTAEAGS